jgi:hypothetical protein
LALRQRHLLPPYCRTTLAFRQLKLKGKIMRTTAIRTGVCGSFITSIALLAAASAAAQGQAQSSSAALPPLNSYVLPNRTASIALPANWRVVQTGIAFIRAQGPNNELAIFGIVAPARNGTTTASAQAGITQPYSAALNNSSQPLFWVSN